MHWPGCEFFSVGVEKVRKCVTPEPDTKQCQFHNRRVLVLDLRRVKSVDAITRQNSLTTAESLDSTYGDCDYDSRSSSVNRDSSSLFHHSTPRNFSVSRSTSPKGGSSKLKNKPKKPSERPGSPVANERSSSPKNLEGVGSHYFKTSKCNISNGFHIVTSTHAHHICGTHTGFCYVVEFSY